jgi:hypothetical protein
LHASKEADFAEGQENLSTWIDSAGRPLADVVVHIEARKFNERMVAIVTLIENEKATRGSNPSGLGFNDSA